MMTYIGTKTIKACHMTRGEYNAYRDWAAPEGEDQTVEGYLVEYEADGKPNHEDHEGYITWSPATAFEKSYKPANTWKERLDIEGGRLSNRLVKLKDFMETDAYKTLPWIERDALNRQMQYMAAYKDVLYERYARAPQPDAEVANEASADDDPANLEIDAPAVESVDDADKID